MGNYHQKRVRVNYHYSGVMKNSSLHFMVMVNQRLVGSKLDQVGDWYEIKIELNIQTKKTVHLPDTLP